MKTVSVSSMRSLDKRAIEEAGIPSETLMERAGIGAGEFILEYVSGFSARHLRRFVLFAGKGNNGGDAYVVARYLCEKTDIPVKLFPVCPVEELSGDAKLNAGRLPSDVSMEVRKDISAEDFREGDVIIDGLLGTGFKEPLKPPYAEWISLINSLELPVISLDIPSGLNGDNGNFSECAVSADMTICMGLPKKGFLCERGSEQCGLLRCVDIGIPQTFIDKIPEESPELILSPDIKKYLGRVAWNSHKNSMGKLLVIGGSRLYPGAPFLTAGAAIRSGAGLVFAAVPASMPPVMQKNFSLIPRRICDGGEGFFDESSISKIESLIKQVDAVAAGPGLGTSHSTVPFMEYLCGINKPKLFDADALNIISENPSIFKSLPNTVLTPHLGEMKRLLKAFKLEKMIDADRVEQVKALASEIGAVIVLKGFRSVIASHEKTVINGSGSPALSTAGSGDVLSGIIGAFLARKISAFEAAVAGTFIHGLCGELSPFGVRGTIADDLPALIPEAMKTISPFA